MFSNDIRWFTAGLSFPFPVLGEKKIIEIATLLQVGTILGREKGRRAAGIQKVALKVRFPPAQTRTTKVMGAKGRTIAHPTTPLSSLAQVLSRHLQQVPLERPLTCKEYGEKKCVHFKREGNLVSLV